MKNPIRTSDLCQYFFHKKNVAQARKEKYQKLYDEQREIYNQTIWHRLFKMNFEDSSAGIMSGLHTKWDDLYFAKMDSLKSDAALKECEYHAKCNQETMYWNFIHFHEYDFYKWCEKNNIPRSCVSKDCKHSEKP